MSYFNWKRTFISGSRQRGFSSSCIKLKDSNDLQSGKFKLHAPGENYKAKNYIVTSQTQKLLQEHLKKTGGQVRTRFPPEPNGVLHIGHAKAININFGYAKENNGVCILRFDDTNPEMENESFVEGIIEMVHWLGFQPHQITYASDYFLQLYEWAEQLIKMDLAYVCHQAPSTANFMNEAKHKNYSNNLNVELSPWRNRSIEDSLKAFKEMRERKYKEGEATLRLKMTTQQRTVDPVAYRIKHALHHRTKSEWCIYPSYDYAHCLCDSIENITHSLCTAEFALRRSTYYWICNALDVYCPVQTEYERLNFLYTVVSKRKISKIIEAGYVKGWDDPRLFTLVALQRRGFPAEAINAFCSRFGLRTENVFYHPLQLEQYVRQALESTAKRIMAVFNPLKVVIVNFPFDEIHHLQVRNIPKESSSGHHTTLFDREIWIEKEDFREESDKNYYRLTKSQSVGLKNTGFVITLEEIVCKSCGEIDYLKVQCLPREKASKPRAYIHWVSKPVEAEVRLYDNLFLHERPDDIKAVPDGFLSVINPTSLKVINALIETSVIGAKTYDRFQFERIGYFAVDPDTTENHFVFNKIVSLKQDKGFTMKVS